MEGKKSVWIQGLTGKMGQELKLAIESSETLKLVGGSNKLTDLDLGFNNASILLDFSSKSGNSGLYEILKKNSEKSKLILIGTTGLNSETIQKWKFLAESADHKILYAQNTSVGVFLTLQAALHIAPACKLNRYDIEIEETHHRSKIDSPSGTALRYAEALSNKLNFSAIFSRSRNRQANEIGVQATRGGGVFGEHKIRFLGDDDEICISHRAFSRSLFAKGAIHLLDYLDKQKPGHLYSLKKLKTDDFC